jgi:hypothetical protein
MLRRRLRTSDLSRVDLALLRDFDDALQGAV